MPYAYNVYKGETSVSLFFLCYQYVIALCQSTNIGNHEIVRSGEEGGSVNPLDTKGLSDLHIVKFGFPNYSNGRFTLPFQPVDATHAANRSAGVSKSNVFRGRSLSSLATQFRCACEWTDRSVRFGKYCLNNRLVFSFEPRCQGLCGSQK